MTEFLEGLFIHLLLILLVILLVNLITLKTRLFYKHRHQKLHLFLLASTLIFFTISYSVPIAGGVCYDLRFIPFLLGGLYGGRKVILALALFTIAIRIPLGGMGFWITLVNMISFASLYILLYPTILIKASRIHYLTIFSLGYAVFAYLIPSFIFDYFHFTAFLTYSIVLTCSTFFVTYLCEVLRNTHIMQLEIMKYEKMETVSHLAASISHEVRNPLTTVRGFLQLIREQPNLPLEAKEYSTLALDETDRASEIINQYLTFAKPHPDVEMVMDLYSELHKSLEIIRPYSLAKGINFAVDLTHSSFIKGDPHKFQQVLLNICKNGIEAMDSEGTLTIHTYEKLNKVFIELTDTGIGMSREQVARLGEPYFSLKGSNGTGLGMMVVFRIVEGMGGSVRIISKEGIGTTVRLSFPALKERRFIDENIL